MSAVVAAAAITGSPVKAQIAVYDPASNVNMIKSLFQDLKSYALQGQQALTQAQTLAQEVQTYYAFVQNPTLGAAVGIMNQAGLSNDLPINPNGLVGLTSGYSMSLYGLGGKLSALSSMANTSYDQNHVYDCTSGSWSCQQQRQRAYGLAGTSGIAQSAYQDLRNHMPVVQALRAQAEAAQTPAQRESVLLALQSEETWHQNLMSQVQAAEMQANTDKQYEIQRDNEKMSHDIEATINGIPGG